MKCVYCGTEPNNSTTDKDLKVCCCYMLEKRNNQDEVQHYKSVTLNESDIKKKIIRQTNRINPKINELKKMDKTTHGNWMLGYYEGIKSTLEDIIDMEVNLVE